MGMSHLKKKRQSSIKVGHEIGSDNVDCLGQSPVAGVYDRVN